MIWKLFKKYEEVAIGTIAVLAVLFIASVYFWSITGILASINLAIAQPEAGNMHGTFNLSGAQQLNLKGQAIPQTQ